MKKAFDTDKKFLTQWKKWKWGESVISNAYTLYLNTNRAALRAKKKTNTKK